MILTEVSFLGYNTRPRMAFHPKSKFLLLNFDTLIHIHTSIFLVQGTGTGTGRPCTSLFSIACYSTSSLFNTDDSQSHNTGR